MEYTFHITPTLRVRADTHSVPLSPRAARVPRLPRGCPPSPPHTASDCEALATLVLKLLSSKEQPFYFWNRSRSWVTPKLDTTLTKKNMHPQVLQSRDPEIHPRRPSLRDQEKFISVRALPESWSSSCVRSSCRVMFSKKSCCC